MRKLIESVSSKNQVSLLRIFTSIFAIPNNGSLYRIALSQSWNKNNLRSPRQFSTPTYPLFAKTWTLLGCDCGLVTQQPQLLKFFKLSRARKLFGQSQNKLIYLLSIDIPLVRYKYVTLIENFDSYPVGEYLTNCLSINECSLQPRHLKKSRIPLSGIDF